MESQEQTWLVTITQLSKVLKRGIQTLDMEGQHVSAHTCVTACMNLSIVSNAAETDLRSL